MANEDQNHYPKLFLTLEKCPDDHAFLRLPKGGAIPATEIEEMTTTLAFASLPFDVFGRAYKDRRDLYRLGLCGEFGTPSFGCIFVFDIRFGKGGTIDFPDVVSAIGKPRVGPATTWEEVKVALQMQPGLTFNNNNTLEMLTRYLALTVLEKNGGRVADCKLYLEYSSFLELMLVEAPKSCKKMIRQHVLHRGMTFLYTYMAFLTGRYPIGSHEGSTVVPEDVKTIINSDVAERVFRGIRKAIVEITGSEAHLPDKNASWEAQMGQMYELLHATNGGWKRTEANA